MIETLGIILVFLGIILIFIGLTRSERREYLYEPITRKYEIPHRAKPESKGFGEYEFDYEQEKENLRERRVEKKVKGAGIIMIGPIPIIIGDSRYAFYLSIVAIILMILAIILMFSIR